MKRLALIAIGVVFFQSTTLAAVPSIERDALVVLYNNTNSAGWKKSTNWLP